MNGLTPAKIVLRNAVISVYRKTLIIIIIIQE